MIARLDIENLNSLILHTEVTFSRQVLVLVFPFSVSDSWMFLNLSSLLLHTENKLLRQLLAVILHVCICASWIRLLDHS